MAYTEAFKRKLALRRQHFEKMRRIALGPYLEPKARLSLRQRIEDPTWNWDKADRYERHAINAVLDLELTEKRITEMAAMLREWLHTIPKGALLDDSIAGRTAKLLAALETK